MLVLGGVVYSLPFCYLLLIIRFVNLFPLSHRIAPHRLIDGCRADRGSVETRSLGSNQEGGLSTTGLFQSLALWWKIDGLRWSQFGKRNNRGPQKEKVPKSLGLLLEGLERETGFEPATFSLGS